jgi:hypothetical protein
MRFTTITLDHQQMQDRAMLESEEPRAGMSALGPLSMSEANISAARRL